MGSPVKPDFIGKKVRVEQQFDEVRIVVTCKSDYEAAVFYEDLIERAEQGDLALTFQHKRNKCPSS